MEMEANTEAVLEVSVFGEENGDEIAYQQVVVEPPCLDLRVGPGPESDLYVPEISSSITVRANADGTLQRRQGLQWKSLLAGDAIRVGNEYLLSANIFHRAADTQKEAI